MAVAVTIVAHNHPTLTTHIDGMSLLGAQRVFYVSAYYTCV